MTAIGDDAAEELLTLLRPLDTAIRDAGAVPAHNNMGLPWPPVMLQAPGDVTHVS